MMHLTNLIKETQRLLVRIIRTQADMAEKTELFIETIPWRAKS
jgi:hypothetical protein